MNNETKERLRRELQHQKEMKIKIEKKGRRSFIAWLWNLVLWNIILIPTY